MTWTPSYTGPGPIKIGLLGDSIAGMVWDDLQPTYQTSPNQFTWAFWGGMRTDNIIGVAWHTDLAASAADHVIVVSGTNDVYNPSYNGFAELSYISQIITAFPTGTQIHWVNVATNLPDPTAASRAPGFNSAVAYFAGINSNVHVVDWNSLCVYLTGMGGVVLEADGIHPNAAGQSLLRNIIVNSIVAHP